jgi:hypothetical protein
VLAAHFARPTTTYPSLVLNAKRRRLSVLDVEVAEHPHLHKQPGPAFVEILVLFYRDGSSLDIQVMDMITVDGRLDMPGETAGRQQPLKHIERQLMLDRSRIAVLQHQEDGCLGYQTPSARCACRIFHFQAEPGEGTPLQRGMLQSLHLRNWKPV